MKYFVFIILIIVPAVGISQNLSGYPGKVTKQFAQTRHLYNNQDYSSALKILNRLIGKNDGFLEACLLKADVLHGMERYEDEADCLEQALHIDSLKYIKVYFALGDVRKKLGQYKKAKQAFTSYLCHAGNNQPMIDKARKGISGCDFAIAQMARAADIKPFDLGDSVNTVFDEYWPSLSLDGKSLVFTRLIPFTDSLTGRQFFQEDFFVSKRKDDKWMDAEPISTINTLNNEGAQAISPDAGLLFFTACSRRDTWGGCDLYLSKKTGNGWSVPGNAGRPVNSAAWESQPSISCNNEFLYFVSNRKGGKGGMDIWRCRLLGFNDENPRWGKAENLGDSINTPGNEMSPFIHPDGQTLYFASDYWQGMGENDLFFAKMKADSSWSKPVNLGYPINTYHDERGLVVDATGKTAYYSTDKAGRGMDIFSFEMPENIRPVPVTYVQGQVVDAKNSEPLSAVVEMADLKNPGKRMQMQADENGRFLVGLPLGQNYLMNVSAPGYLFYSEHFALDDVKASYDPFLLKIRLKPVEPGSVAVLRNIFFETASFQLLPESITELNKLLAFLKMNSSVKIEISGHTDNVGSEQFNLELSSKRAESVYRFLVQSGISESRLSYMGYGFLMPVQTNETVEGRAANRRTEFKIIE